MRETELIGEGLTVAVSESEGWVSLRGIPYDVDLTPGEAFDLANHLFRAALSIRRNKDNKENN